jgi:hypothetical protein
MADDSMRNRPLLTVNGICAAATFNVPADSARSTSGEIRSASTASP